MSTLKFLLDLYHVKKQNLMENIIGVIMKSAILDIKILLVKMRTKLKKLNHNNNDFLYYEKMNKKGCTVRLKINPNKSNSLCTQIQIN